MTKTFNFGQEATGIVAPEREHPGDSCVVRT